MVIHLGIGIINIIDVIRQTMVIRMDGGSHPGGCDPLKYNIN